MQYVLMDKVLFVAFPDIFRIRLHNDARVGKVANVWMPQVASLGSSV